MNALRAMWSDTRMVVLTALSAALFAAILIPFKIIPIIPGVTEVRPANAIPIVCSLLFGPAGAWGAAFGNLVGDFFLGLGPGSIFGMVGNFLYGFIPYAFWRAFFGSVEPQSRKITHWLALVFVCLVSSAACAFTIAWGIDVVIRGVPFAVLGTIIFFNNFVMAILLAPPLLFALLPRVKAWGLLYQGILPAAAVSRPRFAWLGVVLVTLGSLGGLGGGLAIGTGLYDQPLGMPSFVRKVMHLAVPVAPKGAVAAPEAAIHPAGSVQAPQKEAGGDSAKSPGSSASRARVTGRAGLGLGLLPALALLFLGILLL